MNNRIRSILALIFWSVASVLVLVGLHSRTDTLPPLGEILDPMDGIWRSGRQALHGNDVMAAIPGLQDVVEVVRDERGVPHIYASNDFDAIAALGYVVAQDRLFQVTFIPRAAAGRLSEVFGPVTIETDRFLRELGLEWGAQKNYARIRAEGGLEWQMIEAYARGVNAYLSTLAPADLPLEFRLLGYEPEPFTPLNSIRLLQYMTFDLAYRRSDAAYTRLRDELPPEEFERLFPRFSPFAVPIVPEPGQALAPQAAPWTFADAYMGQPYSSVPHDFPLAEGFIEGKGSNNWAVSGERSTTGAPILAGDMHLSLTLPSIWYEAHLVTPTMNNYGVTFPCAPLLVEAFNDSLGWAFTNTGGDVLDRYSLQLTEDQQGYLYEGEVRAFEIEPDTIFVKGGEHVYESRFFSHWGPVTFDEDGNATAMQWTAHKPNRVLQAVWGMNHATSYAAFEDALRDWETPMQNILYADHAGTIAIRSTGYMPLRRQGHGIGLLDGSSEKGEWVGRIPFEALPHAVNPVQSFLTSTNQPPADSTYPYYLGHDWRSVYRSIRADSLLRARPHHSVEDLKRYQADVHAVQRDLFVPLLDSLTGLSEQGEEVRSLLQGWSGESAVDRPEPLIFDIWLDALNRLAWDEPIFRNTMRPGEPQLWRLLHDTPNASWHDVQSTAETENAEALLRLSLEAAADTLTDRHGSEADNWTWGDHHQVVFRHLTQSAALRPLWRGPFAYPGFQSTLSPASGRTVTHSASWRMVVDFSDEQARGYGVYPGGQSGNPLSPLYDAHLGEYVAFRYFDLFRPARPEEITNAPSHARLTFTPQGVEELP